MRLVGPVPIAFDVVVAKVGKASLRKLGDPLGAPHVRGVRQRSDIELV